MYIELHERWSINNCNIDSRDWMWGWREIQNTSSSLTDNENLLK